jgi:hypothetical protein
VLSQALAKTPWLKTVQKNDFALTTAISATEVLSSVELSIVDIITENNGVASKYQIDRHILGNLSVTPTAVNMALARSPILVKPGFGLYSICGIDVDPQALMAAQKSIGGPLRGPYSSPQEIDAAGRIKWEFMTTAYQLDNRILDVPASLARRLPLGEYAIEGLPQSINLVDRGGTKGRYFSRLVHTLKKQGVGIGNKVELWIDPRLQKISLSFGPQTAPVGN